MSLPSIGIASGAIAVQSAQWFHMVELAVPAGMESVVVDLTAPAGFRFAIGVYPDLEPQSTATLELRRSDGAGSLLTRGGKYRLGGAARFRIEMN